MKKFLAFALALMVALFEVNIQADAQAFSGKGFSAEVPFAPARSTTTQIYWRNAANRDTSIRLFTAAAALRDTSREEVWIGGANTVAVFDSIAVKEDTVAYFQVFVEISPDKSAWFRYLPGTGAAAASVIASRTIAANAAIDSASGAMGLTTSTTPGLSAIVSAVNLTPPSWANWMRLIAYKHNSAATDSVTIKTKVVVHIGDE